MTENNLETEQSGRKKLTSILKSFHNTEISDDAKKEYRYVIYVRKSTDDKEKQVRSLSDQILECREYAERIGIKIVEPPIEEAESAKEPDIRPKFREMIQGLRSGKYDGILSWHPDRLSRNMKDAGEIIDMVDKGIIKDLKFVSFSFENTPSGKMLLGITFVISKEYSDKLSENVSRGNRRSIEEGKYINKSKHGYYKDSNQYLRPDGNNFIFIKNAFTMRVAGKTLDEIAEYLNTSGYSRANALGKIRYYKMDKQKVAKIFKDPIYVGVMVYGKEVVNLSELYDFSPATNIEVFKRINKLDTDAKFMRLARSYHKGEDVKANLMRGMVICKYCGETMSAGITTKKKEGVGYFYFRCEEDGCRNKDKSVRAKIILEFIKKYLDAKPFSNETAYRNYKQEMDITIEQRVIQARTRILSLQAQKTALEKKFIKIKEFLVNNQEDAIKQHYSGDLERITNEIKGVNELIEKNKHILESGNTTIVTYEKFLELLGKVPKNMTFSGNFNDIDFLVRKVFLNFTVSQKKVEEFTLNEPFSKFATDKVAHGAR